MSDSGSDIEIKSALSKKKFKIPGSPTDDVINSNLKKTTTKMMITDALIELKTRKGVSVYAIKKFLVEKYEVNAQKQNFLIKKSLKTGVEDGTFIQLKGIGASGSYKLANIKEKVKKPKKKKELEKGAMEKKTKEEPEKAEKEVKKRKKVKLTQEEQEKTEKEVKKTKTVKKTKEEPEKAEKEVKKTKKAIEKLTKKPMTEKKEMPEESKPSKKKIEVTVPIKDIEKDQPEKGKKVKIKKAEIEKSFVKKRFSMMKRKSIGSIKKPPKMKPKHS